MGAIMGRGGGTRKAVRVLHTSLGDNVKAARSLRRGAGWCAGRPVKGA